MSKEAENEKLVTLGIKVNQATKERFDELKTDGAFDTNGQFIECLLERFANPLKVNKDNEVRIKDLEREAGEKDKMINDCKVDIDTLAEENSKLKALLEKSERDLTVALEESGKKIQLAAGQHIISIEPLNWKLLKFVAERESKKRNQEWTIDDVINYFVHFRFEKGSLNGDLDSVPDSVVKRFIMEEEAAE